MIFSSDFSCVTMKLIIVTVLSLTSCVHGGRMTTARTPSPDLLINKCYRYPDASAIIENCCVMAPFFAKEIVRDCGGDTRRVQEIMPAQNVTFYRRSIGQCRTWVCILNRYHLIDENQILDDNKFSRHLDRWVNYYPEFEAAMFDAKIHCRSLHRMLMPLHACKVLNYINCYRLHMKSKCGLYLNTPTCQRQREYYKDCEILLKPQNMEREPWQKPNYKPSG